VKHRPSKLQRNSVGAHQWRAGLHVRCGVGEEVALGECARRGYRRVMTNFLLKGFTDHCVGTRNSDMCCMHKQQDGKSTQPQHHPGAVRQFLLVCDKTAANCCTMTVLN